MSGGGSISSTSHSKATKFHPYSTSTPRHSNSLLKSSNKENGSASFSNMLNNTNNNKTSKVHPFSNLNNRNKTTASNNSLSKFNYDHRSYQMMDSSRKNETPKSAIKKSQPVKTKSSSKAATDAVSKIEAEPNLSLPDQLRVLSSTIKSVQEYTALFEAANSRSGDKNKKLLVKLVPSSFLFEIIGQLDSTVTESSQTGGKEFSIMDTTGRIHCVFYEIDYKLEKMIRGKHIRCMGKFNLREKLFKCSRVHVATDQQIYEHEEYVNLTDNLIN